MPDTDLIVLKQGLERLDKRFQETDLLRTPISTTPEALTDFLRKTDDVGLAPSNRLLSLAYKVFDHLTWKQVCEIFERMLEEDEPDEHTGTFATWVGLAEQMLSGTGRSEMEHEEIFNGLVSLTDRALGDNPDNCGYALTLGISYYHQAMRRDRQPEYIKQARVWLDRVIEWADEGDEQWCAISLLFTAHCHAALEEWQRAMMLYKAVQTDLLGDDNDLYGLAAGIANCERALEKM